MTALNDFYSQRPPNRLAIYRGTAYQSRYEAKWALIFDELAIKAIYEPSHYHLESGLYCPDFWLPKLGVYVEVKPGNYPDPRYAQLGQLRGAEVYTVIGDLPTVPLGDHSEATMYPLLADRIWRKWPEDEASYMLARQPDGSLGFALLEPGSPAKGNDEAILAAYLKASTTRFERL